MEPAGYVALKRGFRFDLQAGEPTPFSLLRRIYREGFLGKSDQEPSSAEDSDPDCLGVLPDFPGLRTLAQEARKPIFHLKPADGAGGSHLKAAQQAHDLFRQLALRIARRLGVEVRI